MTFDRSKFYVRTGSEYKNYEKLMKSKICFFMQGVVYEFEDELELLKGGIEPNPGPKKTKPIHKVAKSYPERVSRVSEDH